MEDLTPVSGNLPIGPRATARWLAARGLKLPPGDIWDVTIGLDSVATPQTPSAHLSISIDWMEWGFMFDFDDRISWIRVVSAPVVHNRDDFGLLRATPTLRNLGTLVQAIEDRFHLRFRRAHATITTTIPDAEDKIRLWMVASL